MVSEFKQTGPSDGFHRRGMTPRQEAVPALDARLSEGSLQDFAGADGDSGPPESPDDQGLPGKMPEIIAKITASNLAGGYDFVEVEDSGNGTQFVTVEGGYASSGSYLLTEINGNGQVGVGDYVKAWQTPGGPGGGYPGTGWQFNWCCTTPAPGLTVTTLGGTFDVFPVYTIVISESTGLSLNQLAANEVLIGLDAASYTIPGAVNNTDQTFGGLKRFGGTNGLNCLALQKGTDGSNMALATLGTFFGSGGKDGTSLTVTGYVDGIGGAWALTLPGGGDGSGKAYFEWATGAGYDVAAYSLRRGSSLLLGADGLLGDGSTVTGGLVTTIVGAGGTVTIGSTTVSGGSNGDVLVVSAGKVNQISTTGSGNAVLATNPTIAKPTLNDAIIVQAANGDTTLQVQRATDTAPTGYFERFLNAASAALWQVDVTGQLTAGTASAGVAQQWGVSAGGSGSAINLS